MEGCLKEEMEVTPNLYKEFLVVTGTLHRKKMKEKAEQKRALSLLALHRYSLNKIESMFQDHNFSNLEGYNDFYSLIS